MSIEIQKQTDYDVNLQYVLEQYKNSTLLLDIIKAFNAEMNKVESALFEIRDNFWLESCEGVQLDTIGAIFSEDRQGRNDTEYRAAITAKASRLYSGTPEGIYEQLNLFYGATSSQYTGPEVGAGDYAQYYMSTDAVITEDELHTISPAGVLVILGKLLILENGDNLVFEDGSYILTTFTP